MLLDDELTRSDTWSQVKPRKPGTSDYVGAVSFAPPFHSLFANHDDDSRLRYIFLE